MKKKSWEITFLFY